MTIRESTEQWEDQFLSPYAAHSRDSRGREVEETPCDIRPVTKETGIGSCIVKPFGD